MRTCKYNVLDFALALIYVPDFMLVVMTLFFLLIAVIAGQVDFSVIPMAVYIVVGSIWAILHLSYLIVYLCSQNKFQYDSDKIVLMGKKQISIDKSQISEIVYTKSPLLLCWLTYPDYGGTVIKGHDEAGEFFSIHLTLFPHVIKNLQKMGYPIVKKPIRIC